MSNRNYSNENSPPDPFLRHNTMYRSIRKTSSRVLYRMKKSVSNLHECVVSKPQTLEEEPVTPRKETSPPKTNLRYRQQKSLCSTPENVNNFSAAGPSHSTPKTPLTPANDFFEYQNRTPKPFARMLRHRMSKLVAKRKIEQIQSPRICKNSPGGQLNREVGRLAVGLKELRSLANAKRENEKNIAK